MFRIRLFALSIIMLVAVVAFAQPDWQEMTPEQQQEMMAMWYKLGTPAEDHTDLEPLVGEWKTTTSIWMAGPDGPPMLDVQDRIIHSTVTIEIDDKHFFSRYDLHAGADYEVFEIVYERKT